MITITQDKLDHAKACTKFLAKLAKEWAEHNQNQGDVIDVQNNLQDVIEILNGNIPNQPLIVYDHRDEVVYKDAFNKGYAHTFCGMTYKLTDNPYNYGTTEHSAWIDGYYEGIEAT